MKTITVPTSRTYLVKVGSGLLSTLGAEAAAVSKASRVCIVSDSNVWPLYGKIAQESLQSAGFQPVSYVFPAGEASKNGETYLSLLNFLAESYLTRSDLIVALGGGVVGDLAGFAAATYLRGIGFIQVPTTLLAAVDSSVGGKTAIDLPAGKNLAGAFCQPVLVLCDIDTLHTLPEDIFRDGCAEIIKYAILFSPELFTLLAQTGLDFPREEVISRCVELKRDVVTEDEFDRGLRMLLNLGHTFGHGVEAQSGFTVSHGKAVAIGTAIMARAAASRGLCSSADAERMLSLLKLFGLPTSTEYAANQLVQSALSDKKRSADTVNLIVPYTIGDCRALPTPVSDLQSFLEAGL